MTLDELHREWQKDAQIDISNLKHESITIPNLHSKWWNILIQEKKLFKRLEIRLAKIKKIKKEYYRGLTPKEVLKEKGWDQFELEVDRNSIKDYVEADDDYIEVDKELYVQKLKVDFINDIIKCINYKRFVVKNAIDVIRFEHGE